MRFGVTLQLLRGHAGLSLRALAGRVGVSAAYLSRLEHGRDPVPTAERALGIAEALGFPGPLMHSVVDELRGDAADWLRLTATGRRLAAELRRRELTEAQLARVLAFVRQEFPLSAPAAGLRPLLCAERVLLGVRVPRLEDAWALAALRLADGADALALRDALGAAGPSGAAVVGAGTAISFAHARPAAPDPRACLLVFEAPLDRPTEDGLPVRVAWALDGVPRGAAGAELLVAVARLADPGLVAELGAAAGPAQALRAVGRYESRGDG